MIQRRIAVPCGLLAWALVLMFVTATSARAQAVPPVAVPVDVRALDRSADACVDFYQFACGGWLAAHEIPADQSRWGRFNELEERNRAVLLDILHKVSADRADRTPIEKKIGDYFATCMDEAAVNAKGSTPIAGELDRIDRVGSKSDLPGALARLHGIGIDAVFGFGSEQDFKDATRILAIADQGGLSLPDRDYYTKTDERSVEIQKKFVAHVQRMLELLGVPSPTAQTAAKTVMDIETAMARVSMDLVSRRDPTNLYHLMTPPQLASLTPAFDWPRYFKDLDTPPVTELNVVAPDFFKGVNEIIASRSLDDWKTYLRWHVLRANAMLLSAPFVDENFAFHGGVLRGQQQNRPREKRCADYVDTDLGEAIGQPYVQVAFGPDAKKRTLEMVQELQRALEADTKQLSWMTEPTRKQAIAKLAAMRNKIGYPDAWRDYASLEISRGDLVGNSWRANSFEMRRQLAKIGKPVDRNEWQITPPTVNAGYNPLMNDITFPAGILQPPFFFQSADDAVNYGAIGSVVGHEITHGFDDMGRQFDAAGNQSDWWTEDDAKEFEKRADCFVKQYSTYTVIDDVKLNGQLTLGENVADNGGLRIAYMALAERLKGQAAASIDGFTPQQRFFLGFGQVWCEESKPETIRMLAQVDPHSPGRFRVNGVVSTMPEFAEAFQCKSGAPMAPENTCRVW